MDISKARCVGCGNSMTVTRMTCGSCDLVLVGQFEIPSLARLSVQDQIFVAAFLYHHGSIKKMESLFDISYPTVKNRLNAIGAELQKSFQVASPNLDVLDRLARGEISVDDALGRIR
jgi:hypothetical protein